MPKGLKGFQKGNKLIPWNKGKKMSDEYGRTMSESHKGIPSPNKGKKGLYHSGSFKKGHKLNVGNKSWLWKGDKVSYGGLHTWVKTWKGEPKICQVCGTVKAKKYEWANIDHKYRRVLEDFIRMCTKCHRKYDIEHNNYANR